MILLQFLGLSAKSFEFVRYCRKTEMTNRN